MTQTQLKRSQYILTSLITLMILSLLAWQYTHEGVPSHYLFQRPDLPELSNWWGAIVLPLLTWVLVGRMNTKLLNAKNSAEKEKEKMVVGFISASIYGVLLTVAFFQGYQEIASILFPSILAIAIFVPVFREEYLLGFILAMSFCFGAVLPLIFTTLIAMASATVYFTVRFIWEKLYVKKNSHDKLMTNYFLSLCIPLLIGVSNHATIEWE